MREADTETVYRAFVAAVRFFYHNGPRLIVLSTLWFVCSLPLVTIGPATLGTYAAIASLRRVHYVDRGYVAAVLKRHGVSAALLTGVPLVLAAIAFLYVRQYLATPSTLSLALGVVTTYAAAYTALVLVPTFAGLATGVELETALRAAVGWTAGNALAAVTMAMATVMVFLVTALLTIAFVVVFAGLSFSFHLETVLEPMEDDDEGGESGSAPW